MILKKLRAPHCSSKRMLFYLSIDRIKKNINLDASHPVIEIRIYHSSVIFNHTNKVGMNTSKSLKMLGFPQLRRHGMVEYFLMSHVEMR